MPRTEKMTGAQRAYYMADAYGGRLFDQPPYVLDHLADRILTHVKMRARRNAAIRDFNAREGQGR